MRKMKLELEALSVESFETGRSRMEERGTVFGHNHTRGGHITCGGTCDGGNTCECPVTVDVTCLEPCGTTLCGGDSVDSICGDSIEICGV